MLLQLQRINQVQIFLHFYRLFPGTLTALMGHGLDYLISHLGRLILRVALISTLLPFGIVVTPSVRKAIVKNNYPEARHDITLGFTLGIPSLAGNQLPVLRKIKSKQVNNFPHRFCLRSSAYSKYIAILGR